MMTVMAITVIKMNFMMIIKSCIFFMHASIDIIKSNGNNLAYINIIKVKMIPTVQFNTYLCNSCSICKKSEFP